MTDKHHDEKEYENPEELTEEELEIEDDEIGRESGAHEQDQEETEESKLRDQLLRTHAQMENLKRRAERDVSHAHKYAVEKLLKELLLIVDSLEQALELGDSTNDALKAMHEGVELTLKMFIATLEKFGVKQMNPLHEKFDPNKHEAMTMAPSEEHDVNTVITVVQKGYIMHDRVVRPARVIVAK